MIILIDGYNLLRQIFPKVAGLTDKQRQQFIQQLAYYKFKKKESVKDIIVVFDAGPLAHATREVKSGIIVVFSGQKSDADTWIQEYVEKHKNEEILLVTFDKKLKDSCRPFGVSLIGSTDFYNILKNVILEDAQASFEGMPADSGAIEKYEENYVADLEGYQPKHDSKALDLLMEQANLNMPKEETEASSDKTRKGNADTLSKKEKRIKATLKKLY